MSCVALRVDIAAAARRLDEGAGISATLSLPRLAARIENERIRCGLVDASGSFAVRTRSESADTESLEQTPQHDGIVVITEELREDSSIRLLLHDGSPQQVALACTRAAAHTQRIPHERQRAHLQAQMLLASSLFAAGRVDSAKEVVAPAVSKSAELGLKQFLIEGGPQMLALARNLLTDKDGFKTRGQSPASGRGLSSFEFSPIRVSAFRFLGSHVRRLRSRRADGNVIRVDHLVDVQAGDLVQVMSQQGGERRFDVEQARLVGREHRNRTARQPEPVPSRAARRRPPWPVCADVRLRIWRWLVQPARRRRGRFAIRVSHSPNRSGSRPR